MNKGLEILMARMDSNPDEFTDKPRWERLLDKYDDVFSEEDIKVFREKHNALHQDKFTELVMKELFKEEPAEEANPFINAMPLGGGTHANSAAQAQAMQAQLAYNNALAQSMSATSSVLASNISNVAFRGSNEVTSSISFGGETLTAKMVKKLKRLIK